MSAKIECLEKLQKDIKEKFPDCICVFRVGDFYELINKDAVLFAKMFGSTVVNRKTYLLTGIPYHCFEIYLQKMIAAGLRVAVYENVNVYIWN